MNVPWWSGGQAVDSNGNFTPEYSTFQEQQRQVMQQNLSNEGFVIPQQNTSDIGIIEPTAKEGTLLYNSDTNQLLVRLSDGTFHPILTS